jgi:hypothetical protein
LNQNPVNESLEFFVEMLFPGKLSCNLYDLTGREVWSLDKNLFASCQEKIDAQISHLTGATYILRVCNSNSSQSVKIIKF